MSLEPGTRFGSFEIVAPLGAGGMGEVWRARDTRLGRDVALKLIGEAFTADLERLGRFEREAKLLASLHHPHIAVLYGQEEADGRRALVMELVEGPTLADRLAAGGVPAEGSAVSRRGRSPRPSSTRTRTTSSIATSSPPTSRSLPRAR